MIEYRDEVVASPQNMDIPSALRMGVLNLPQKFVHERFVYIKTDSRSTEYTSLADMGIMAYLKRLCKHSSITYRYATEFCKGKEMLVPLCCLELDKEPTIFDLREMLERAAHDEIWYCKAQIIKTAIKKLFKKYPKMNDPKNIVAITELFEEYVDSEGKFSAYNVSFKLQDCREYILQGLEEQSVLD